MRGTFRIAIALAVLALCAPARAQDATAEVGASAEATPATAETAPATAETAPATAGTTAATAETEPAIDAPPTAVTLPPAPPIMVVAVATGRVPVETTDAVRAAIVAQVEPMAGGRPVLPLMAPELQAAIGACADAPCVGAQVASAGAVGAIVARLARRAARGPVDVRIEMVDPVSGAPRTPPIVYSLAVEGEAIAGAIGPLVEQLRAAMFSPPPPPPQILVTVNVDGATVRIDDEVIGQSPVASRVVAPGRHVIMVQRSGYAGVRREVDVDLGENERIDITLAEAIGAIRGGGGTEPGTTPDEQQWYENWVIWAGVGGGVVVVGVVIGVAVAVSSSQPQAPSDPSGIPLPPIQ